MADYRPIIISQFKALFTLNNPDELQVWLFQIQNALAALDLDEHLKAADTDEDTSTSRVKTRSKVDSISTEEKKEIEWLQHEKCIRSLVWSKIHQKFWPPMRIALGTDDCTVAQLITAVQSTILARGGTDANKLRTRLSNIRKTPATSLQVHIDQVNSLIDNMALVGKNLDQEDKIYYLLESMIEDTAFNTAVDVARGQATYQKDYGELCKYLLSCERKPRKPQTEKAALAGTSTPHSKQSFQKDRQGKNSSPQRRIKGNCFQCGKPGHLARDCRSKQSPKQAPPQSQKDRQSTKCKNCDSTDHNTSSCRAPAKNTQGLIVTNTPQAVSGVIACVAKQDTHPTIVIDSGASCHLTGETEGYTAMRPSQGQVGTAYNGTALPIDSAGQYTLSVTQGTGTKVIQLDDTQHCKDASHTLMSVGATCTKHPEWVLVFDNDRCRALANAVVTGDLVFEADKDNSNNLYYLQGSHPQARLTVPDYPPVAMTTTATDPPINCPTCASAFMAIADVSTLQADAIPPRLTDNTQATLPLALPATVVPSKQPERQSAAIKLWHKRLAHLPPDKIPILAKASTGIDLSAKIPTSPCHTCLSGKQAANSITRHPKPPKEIDQARVALKVDLIGPIHETGKGGHHYVMDGITSTGKHFVKMAADKQGDTIFPLVKDSITFFDRQNAAGGHITMLGSDRGKEFVNHQTDAFLADMGIKRRLNAPGLHEQNGQDERSHRTLMNTVRCAMIEKGLPLMLWPYAVEHSAYLMDLRPLPHDDSTTGWEVFYGTKPDLCRLRTFGCMASVLADPKNRLDTRSEYMVYLGIDPDNPHNARFFHPPSGKVVISFDYKPLEDKSLYYRGKYYPEGVTDGQTPPGNNPGDPDWNPARLVPPPHPDPHPRPAASPDEISDADEPLEDLIPPPRRGKGHRLAEESEIPNLDQYGRGRRTGVQIDRLMAGIALRMEQCPEADLPALLDDETQRYALSYLKTPESQKKTLNHSQAMKSSEADQYKQALFREYDNLKKHEAVKLVPYPKDLAPGQLIGTVLTYTQKSDGTYKARVCANGAQRKVQMAKADDASDLDIPTYSSTIRLEGIRTITADASQRGCALYHSDCKGAFLNEPMREGVFIYLRIPPLYAEWLGLSPQALEGQVLLVLKAIYGLPESGRIWQESARSTLHKMGFKSLVVDPNIYVKGTGDRRLTLGVWVDDIIASAVSNTMVYEDFRQEWSARYDTHDYGQLTRFAGLEFSQNPDTNTISISQPDTVRKILKRFGMDDCHPVDTPMRTDSKLEPWIGPPIKEPYLEAVMSLNWLALGVYFPLKLVVSILSQFSKNPGPDHWQAVKHAMRYLKGKIDFSLDFVKRDELTLTAYADASFAGMWPVHVKSRSGSMVLLNDTPVLWSSSLIDDISTSTMESEYVSAFECSKDLKFFAALLEGLEQPQRLPLKMFEDNKPAIALSAGQILHKRSRHIDIKYHYVRDLVAQGFLKLIHIGTEDMIADLLTKPLPRATLVHLLTRINVHY